ncbi:MAG: hypothetical protein ACI4IQ_01330 [Eubacterium sp.]
MKIENPEVTLADEARSGVKEEIRSGFLDWLHTFSVTGDDGEAYILGGSILSMAREQLDVVSITYMKGSGNIRQLKSSVYKIADFPGEQLHKLIRNPSGTLNIEQETDMVTVTCGAQYKVICHKDNSWELFIDTGDGEYKAHLIQKTYGGPLWYGRETPSALTQHSITYGYNWCGEAEGDIEIKGKKIHVTGKGLRERYVAVDSSAAELGGWEDWGFFGFDQLHCSLYDMRLGMKDFAFYDLEDKKYYPEGKLTIEHEDWAFLRALDGFIPTTYKVKIEVEDGVLEIEAHAVNASTWGVTYKVPDNPVATLKFGEINGRFVYKDGRVKKLTGGMGDMSIRQWHQYPNMLPRELYCDDELTGEKFDTL